MVGGDGRQRGGCACGGEKWEGCLGGGATHAWLQVQSEITGHGLFRSL